MQTSLYRLAPCIRITEEQLNAVEGWVRFYVVYLFELRQKFPRNVFHVDHLLNEESGGPRAKEIEDLKDRGERCIVSLRFGFSLAHHFSLSTHTYFFFILSILTLSSKTCLSSNHIRYVAFSWKGNLSLKLHRWLYLQCTFHMATIVNKSFCIRIG